jgi:uncharacterized membrane protein
MLETVKPIAKWASGMMEMIGIFLIVGLALYALVFGVIHLFERDRRGRIYQKIRQDLGQGILLGLEFLVAADIIHTVAVELTFETVGVLAVIVLIRTFLSFTLEVELTGRWPWQNKG